jgi:hypothetical protein
MIEKRVLITNLGQVILDKDLRTHCNALVLERVRSRCEIRGFGTEGAWPVFVLTVPTIDHDLHDNQLVLLSADGSPLKDARTIGLWRNNPHQPFDIQVFEWDSEDNERGHRFAAIWSALEESVARHWYAPYMPRLVHMEPAQARALPSRATERAK